MTLERALYMTAVLWNVLTHKPWITSKKEAYDFLGWNTTHGSNYCPLCAYMQGEGLDILGDDEDTCVVACPLRKIWPHGCETGYEFETLTAWEVWLSAANLETNQVNFSFVSEKGLRKLTGECCLWDIKRAAAIQIRDAAITELELVWEGEPKP